MITVGLRSPARRVISVVLATALLGGLVSACSSGAPLATGNGGRADKVADTVPPNRSLTSFGAQFLTTCLFSHTLDDDPILHHGLPGESHRHEFFGSISTDASSTFDSLVHSETTCSDDGDRSAYWVPALFVDGERVQPTRADAYYRVAPGIVPSAVEVYPNGFQSIGGNQHATTPPDLQVAAWACGLSPNLSHTPPKDCTKDRPVQLRVTFPSCWDGHTVDSTMAVSHVSYPSPTSGCDSAHPVPLSQLTLVVHYPLWSSWDTASLASGNFDTAHADFFSGWQPQRINDQVTGCINHAVTCGIVGGTFHTGEGNGDNDQYNMPPTGPGSTTLPLYDGGVTTTSMDMSSSHHTTP